MVQCGSLIVQKKYMFVNDLGNLVSVTRSFLSKLCNTQNRLHMVLELHLIGRSDNDCKRASHGKAIYQLHNLSDLKCT